MEKHLKEIIRTLAKDGSAVIAFSDDTPSAYVRTEECGAMGLFQIARGTGYNTSGSWIDVTSDEFFQHLEDNNDKIGSID